MKVSSVMREGIHGTYYYHISYPDSPERGLCGDPTMTTSIPLSSWGYVGHLKERYCSRCHKIYLEMNDD